MNSVRRHDLLKGEESPQEVVEGELCIAAHVCLTFPRSAGLQGRSYGLKNDENDCRFEVQREEHWIHKRPTWSIAAREWLLEIFCD